MKKAFISVYVLIILLLLGLSVTFLSRQNQTNLETTMDLYYKKQAMFEAESVLNILIKNYPDKPMEETFNSLDKTGFDSQISFYQGFVDNDSKIIESRNTKSLKIIARNKNSQARAWIFYKEDNDKKIDIVYRLVY